MFNEFIPYSTKKPSVSPLNAIIVALIAVNTNPIILAINTNPIITIGIKITTSP